MRSPTLSINRSPQLAGTPGKSRDISDVSSAFPTSHVLDVNRECDLSWAYQDKANYQVGFLGVHQLIHKSLSGVNLAPNVVTVSLRSRSHRVPIQQWHFTDQPIIKIGRCADNHIVLRSSVVSRHHLELRRIGNRWKLINFGNNGTYKDGQPITELEIQKETLIRLALSGPQLQINLSATVPEPLLKLLRHHDSDTENHPLPGRLRTLLSGS